MPNHPVPPRRGRRAGTAAVLAVALAATLPSFGAVAAEADAPPEVGQGTHFLDHASYLEGMNDPDWYESNIPFVDLPDEKIQDVYYYRWRVWKEHLRYTNPDDGWILTEFLDCCGYAAPYQAIDAAAGHQITEGRWVRDREYLDDYTKFWLTGPGAGAKPATETFNPDTTDWAHQYSFWVASAAYGRAKVTGDLDGLADLLPELKKQYAGWDGQFDEDLGLYWSVPVWDAMELSASSAQSDDPYHGGDGFRPTLNSYQYGDASAISDIARLVGDDETAAEYAAKARALKAAMKKWLWDPERQFYLAMPREDNPDHELLDTREEIGYVPWQFGAADDGTSAAWSQLLDPQGFAAPFGPTTAERRSPWYTDGSDGCCHWDGPSWPFSTSQTLTGLANLLQDGPVQDVVTRDDYADALETYARTQYKNGKPYVAEAHSADQDRWIYDGQAHSEDYLHSTYTDLVLSGLLGLQPQADDTLRIDPLVPADWDHFAVENAPYHGHDVSVLWDEDGSHYGQGPGLKVYVDGRLVTSSDTVQGTTVTVGETLPAPGQDAPRVVNDAANALRTGYPKPIASYTWRSDDAWNGIDGKTWYDEVPQSTRWTNYSSPNAQDWYGVDLGVPTPVSHVRWSGYSDGGGVRPAAGYRLQYLHDGAWTDVPDQTRASDAPVGNGPNDVTFPQVTTTQLRLLFTNPAGAFVGVTELEAWSASSLDADVSVGPASAAGPVPVDGPTRVTVTVRDTTGEGLADAAASLALPAGWTSAPVGSAPGAVPAGGTADWAFTVTPPAGAASGATADVRAEATYTGPGGAASTHTRQSLRVAYPVGPTAPVGAWSLDEGRGTVAADSSGGGHDLALAGGPSWTAGAPGGTGAGGGTALTFDGKAQSAATSGPVLDTSGSFTVSARVNLASTGSWATAVSQDGTTTSGFFLQYSAADGRFAFSTEQGRALADAVPEKGRWYHLVGVRDANAGTYTLYVDGVAQKQVLSQASGPATSGAFAVGRGKAGGRAADLWPGAVDDVRAWQRALPAADVAALDADDAPALAVDVTAVGRCVGQNAYVAVRATNTDDVVQGLRLQTPFGSTTVAGVAPGKSASQSFNSRAGSIEGGSVTVTATGTVDGQDVTTDVTADYDAVSCR
ncbi:LamG-like jellyroll fold domain-containing protein [Cellulomonas sp. PhB143]|uniref:MGH1-like glycoside hydrolase domain-containing protein n=1 Tax=Cellulomonas sp. PhB143 TaxID=2485186 RepID=UPI000F486893|nr:LamG-like jellyroll fold domain-containing protein [Cellulomonas sp. PhB143]ROS75262.1 alpha-galactosidase-like protein [Cellulomonas sp. PhB143]